MTDTLTLPHAMAVRPCREALLPDDHAHRVDWRDEDAACDHAAPSSCLFCCPDVMCGAQAELVRLATARRHGPLAPVGPSDAVHGLTLTDASGTVRVSLFALVLPADETGDPYCCAECAADEYATHADLAEDCHAEIAVYGPTGMHRLAHTAVEAFEAATALAQEV